MEFDGRCYKFYGLEDADKLDWNNASLACRNNSITRWEAGVLKPVLSVSVRMHNGELPPIHSSIQQAFLVAAAAKFAVSEDYAESSFWIGLQSQAK